MLKIKFSDTDATEIAYLNAIETEEYFGGSSRRTLTFELARDAVDIETLDKLCTEDNCSIITLTNDEMGATNVHEGYVLKLKVGVEPKLVQTETPDSPAMYEDRIIVKLGKRTYIEQQLKTILNAKAETVSPALIEGGAE